MFAKILGTVEDMLTLLRSRSSRRVRFSTRLVRLNLPNCNRFFFESWFQPRPKMTIGTTLTLIMGFDQKT